MRYRLQAVAACLAGLTLFASAAAGGIHRYPAPIQNQPNAYGRKEYLPYAPTYRSNQPAGRRFWVQFRQPFWRDHSFSTRQELDIYAADRLRNGWEVQVYGDRRARDRLMHWGGSQVFDFLPDAQSWAQQLEDQEGYETRIVNHP